MKHAVWIVGLAALMGAAPSTAGTLRLPGPVFVDARLVDGAVFAVGPLTGSDTLAFGVTGEACVLENRDYCANAAGIATTGIFGAGGFQLFDGDRVYGALGLRIEGVGEVQLFASDAAGGLGAVFPPLAFTLAPTSLAALGFGAFALDDAIVSFRVIDTVVGDNSGGFTLTQPVGEPASAALVALGMAVVAVSRAAARQRLRAG